MSSLDTAIASAVSGLSSQGTSIAIISQNIANANTTGYKVSDVRFSSLVTGAGATASGVVTTSTTTNLASQGAIASTNVATHLAVQGGGFFIVTNSVNVANATSNNTSSDHYTRNGAFTADKNGFLVNNEGQYLLGQPTDPSGAILSKGTNDLTSLQPVYVNASQGSAKGTSRLAIGANLPANAAAGTALTTSTEIFDSLGISSTVTETWTKDSTLPNVWHLTLSNPAYTSDTTKQSGALSATSTDFDITFNGDGTIATATETTAGTSLTTSDIPLAITWTGTGETGANDSAISLNLGTAGQSNQLTQFTSTTTIPSISVAGITQDGLPFGKLTGVTIDKTGLVTASFDNGLKEPVYQIPLGTFTNPNGLTLVGGSVYSSSTSSGPVVLAIPNTGTAGTIESSALESSNTDTTTSLSQLVTSQQSYNAASKVISTVNAMYQALVQAI